MQTRRRSKCTHQTGTNEEPSPSSVGVAPHLTSLHFSEGQDMSFRPRPDRVAAATQLICRRCNISPDAARNLAIEILALAGGIASCGGGGAGVNAIFVEVDNATTTIVPGAGGAT